DGPVLRYSGPDVVSVGSCDRENPPKKLVFATFSEFTTPDGVIDPLPTLLLHDPNPPYIWSAKANSNLYQMEFIVTVDGSDAWVLVVGTHEGQPMQYGDFDLEDVPGIPGPPLVPSPVGIFKRGNAQSLDGLPAGITWTGGLTLGPDNFVSVLGQ